MSTGKGPNKQTGYNGRRVDWPLVFLIVVTVALGFFFLYTLLQGIKKPEEVKPPRVVQLLFSEWLKNEGNPNGQQEALRLCMAYGRYETDTLAQNALEEDTENFLYVLSSRESDRVASSYAVERVADGFVEIVLYDAEGEPMYPKVAMAYTLDEQGLFITDYTIGRLQPFSTRDEEYVKVWN